MRLPKQCPDVVRDVTAEAQVSGEVAPAGILGTIAKVAVPLLGSFL